MKEKNYRKSTTGSEPSNTAYEYEIMDESGNVLKLDGGEELKKLAASVKFVKQADGTTAKEYILSDPNIIHQIKGKIKSATNVGLRNINVKFDNADEPNGMTRIPVQTYFDTSQVPYLTAELNHVFKQPPQQTETMNLNRATHSSLTNSQKPPDKCSVHVSNESVKPMTIQSELKKNSPSNQNPKHRSALKQVGPKRYEIITKSGNLVHFTIDLGQPSEADLCEIRDTIEDDILKITEYDYEKCQPKNNSTSNNHGIFSNQKPTENSLNRLKMNKSCENLSNISREFKTKKPSNSPDCPSVTKIVYGANVKSENLEACRETMTHDLSRSQPKSPSNRHCENLPENRNQISNTSDNIENITPEMTEQLILKLLLQQLMSQSHTSKPPTDLPPVERLSQPTQPLLNSQIHARPTLKRSSAFTNYVGNNKTGMK
jgi:hypothetical protein